jgi:hypothetical protein
VRAINDLGGDLIVKAITELEAGRVPWVQPWGTAAAKAPLAMPKKDLVRYLDPAKVNALVNDQLGRMRTLFGSCQSLEIRRQVASATHETKPAR